MSIESAKAFIDRMKTDEEFRNRVTATKTVEERKAIVEAEGFEFSAEDIEEGKNSLSEDELEIVSGGGGSPIHCVKGVLNY
ncbi:MAG: Nif11-like leader peptide family natural product precursor [Deltaproteobacteria bacterium]|jgi:predicted ribosomally synthesized peptide with nif11-like leader|nr:Nif11-like leader peptide family natural product precursor [Deltaproteobacteria bacterium]